MERESRKRKPSRVVLEAEEAQKPNNDAEAEQAPKRRKKKAAASAKKTKKEKAKPKAKPAAKKKKTATKKKTGKPKKAAAAKPAGKKRGKKAVEEKAPMDEEEEKEEANGGSEQGEVNRPLSKAELKLKEQADERIASFQQQPFGRLLSFGSGDCSQLGLGPSERMRERKKPTLAPSFKTQNVVQLAVGSLHGAVILQDGTLWTWGCNDDHALGRVCGDKGEGESSEWEPHQVKGDLEGKFVVSVCCGSCHTIALTADGDVYSWGTYRDGTGPMGFSEGQDSMPLPLLVPGLPRNKITHIASADEVDMAVDAGGNLFQWGDTGIGARHSSRHSLKMARLHPHKVSFPRVGGRLGKVVGCWAGGATCFAKTADGSFFVWGPNNYGQCGFHPGEEDEMMYIPTPKNLSIQGVEIVAAAAASHHAVFLGSNGSVYTTGRGASGRLGHGDEKTVHTPKAVTALDNLPGGDVVVGVAVGDAHSIAWTRDGHVYAWGDGDLLQLGNGEEGEVFSPFRITSQELDTFGRKVLQAAGGSQHTCLLGSPIPTDTSAPAPKVAAKPKSPSPSKAEHIVSPIPGSPPSSAPPSPTADDTNAASFPVLAEINVVQEATLLFESANAELPDSP